MSVLFQNVRLNAAELPVLPPERVKFHLPSLSILLARFLRQWQRLVLPQDSHRKKGRKHKVEESL